MMKLKKIAAALISLLLAALMLTGCAENGYDAARDATGSAADASSLIEIRILDVGQGLSVLVETDGHYMIYDGGGRDYSSYVVAYLEENNISRLDYLVASHYDEDHISGLVGVLSTVTVDTALTPDYETDTVIYESFRNMLAANGADEIHPSTGDVYTLGDAEIRIINADYDYDSENNRSIAIRIEYGDFSVMITGDAEKEAEEDMLHSGYDLDSDLYVAGHHGSSTSSCEAFAEAVSPEYAVISAGMYNPYGHPHVETLATFKSLDIELYRTDIQGEIICYSDGTSIWFNTESTDNWQSGTEISSAGSESSGSTAASSSDEEQEYVLNTNSMRFHYPDCEGVSRMNESNKETVTATRDELIEKGYSPCGECNP